MKEFQLYGLGNALVDIFIEVSDAEFASLGFERGSSRLVEPAEQKALLERFKDHDLRLVSGGSVANSVIAFSQLGGAAAFLGCVGDDRYGLFYETEFEELGIDTGNMVLVGETTGTCVCVITPDAERTMRVSLACAGRLAARHVDEERLKKAEWLFIEGYGFANPADDAGGDPHRPAPSPASTASRWPSPAPRRSSSTPSATPSSRCSSRPTCCSATRTRPRP